MQLRVKVNVSDDGLVTWRMIDPPSSDWLNYATRKKLREAVIRAAGVRRIFLPEGKQEYELQVRTI